MADLSTSAVSAFDMEARDRHYAFVSASTLARGIVFSDKIKLVEETSEKRLLNETSTWAVAAVAAVIILASLFLEKIIHKLGKWFIDRQKNALFEALERVKIELMVLGFISLLLTFFERYIQMICIPEGVAKTFMPCHFDEHTARKLSSYDHRYLSETSKTHKCKQHGKVPLISAEGLHDLHILLFFLAVSHVIYSALTMLLGRLKIRGWKVWEQEAMAPVPEFSDDPARFRLAHETSFVRAHTSFWTRIPVFFYVGCFFRQFFRSVSRSDYTTLRNGFINEHLAPGSKFNFQKYIKRSLEDDFKLLVEVSPMLWASFVLFLFLNVYGWKTLYWATAVPPFIILAIGTELQSILTKMAVEIKERHAVVQGIPLVHGSDQYFWFGRPQMVLHLIHFALFTSVYQIAYFLWNWYSFGLHSCIDAGYQLVIVKVLVGILMICLCSYITLPLYALVTQMGSRMKKSIFDDQTSNAIKKWRKTAALHKKEGKIQTRTLGGGQASAPPHILHRHRTTGHSGRGGEQEMFDVESEPLTPSPVYVRVDPIQDTIEEHSGAPLTASR